MYKSLILLVFVWGVTMCRTHNSLIFLAFLFRSSPFRCVNPAFNRTARRAGGMAHGTMVVMLSPTQIDRSQEKGDGSNRTLSAT